MPTESQATAQLDTDTDDTLDLEGIAADLDESQDDDAPEGEDRSDDIDDDEGDAAAAVQAGEGDDPEIEFDHGGQKLRAKRSELIAGYMKDADYRQKTATLAEQRRHVEAAVAQVQQEREARATQLDVLLGALHAELVGDQAELAQLVESNPAEYLKRSEQIRQRTALFQQALTERQAIQQRAVAEQAQARQQRLVEEQRKLLEKLPTWREATKATAEQKEIAQTLIEHYGYSPEEVGGLADHRALLIARDAMLYRKQQAARTRQTAAAPRRPIRPGAAQPTQAGQQAAAAQKAAERLKRNPNSLDALSSFASARGGI